MNDNVTVKYPEGRLIDPVIATAKQFPANLAYEFMGKKRTYARFVEDVDVCARALTALGVPAGDSMVAMLAMHLLSQAID